MPVTIATDPIVVTASRAPESETRTPASVTIIDPIRSSGSASRWSLPCCA